VQGGRQGALDTSRDKVRHLSPGFRISSPLDHEVPVPLHGQSGLIANATTAAD
jgi:hypothetical protein